MPDPTPYVPSEPFGLTENTPKYLQLNAGVFIEGLNHSTATDAASFQTILNTALADRTKILGATRGGGTFVATPETREPELDGKRYRTKGLILFDSWDVRLTGTLVEAYPGNFLRVLASSEKDSASTNTKEIIKLRTNILDTDYIASLSWVSLLGDGSYMVIDLTNVVNLDGVTFTFADKNEGTIPFNFAACASTIVGNNNAPFTITYYHPAAAQEEEEEEENNGAE